jgi:ArsR family transcriptional regulator
MTLIALRALADGTRLTLARLLLEGPFNVGEVQEILVLGQSTASHHLKVLVEAGMLSCRREGRIAWYEWEASLPSALDLLRTLVREHSPALEADARRRLHTVYESRVAKTRSFFEGAAADAALRGQVADRPSCSSVDVIGSIAAQISADAIVADLGTGIGRLLGPLRSRARQVIGIDASPRMLDRAGRLARDNGWGDIDLRLGTLEHLPLRDGEVDVAVAHQVLHHAAQPSVALSEARRALRPGGQLIIGDYLPHDREWMREDLADLWLGFEPAAFARMLSEAGFEDVTVTRHEARGEELGMFLAVARRPMEVSDRQRPPRVLRSTPRTPNRARKAARGARA